MAEPEEPETQRSFPSKSKEILTSQTQPPVGAVERENLIMDLDLDLDLDLDSSWTFDQIFSAATNSGNPFLLHTSEQPCSPLWAFPDENNEDKPSGNSTAVGFRHSDHPRLLPCKLVLEAFDSICESLLGCNKSR